MPDYRVELDIYHGPLDLLLYLIKRDEIDINDIPIAHITKHYMEHLKTLEVLDINLAGEFLVMAATLLEIKSALMIPREQSEADGEIAAADDPTDPRYELIHQLLAYKRYKDAATQLDDRREKFESRFPRIPVKPKTDEEDKIPELDMEDIQLWDLVEAFNRIMEQVGSQNQVHEVVHDDTPIELHAADIVDRLTRDGNMPLQKVFEGRTPGQMVGLFLAMLELTRQRRLKFKQNQQSGEISLKLRTEEQVQKILAQETAAGERKPSDPNNPDDFDWPDEHQKKRYTRRIERRTRGEKIAEDEELEHDIAELEAEENVVEQADGNVEKSTEEEAEAQRDADTDNGTI